MSLGTTRKASAHFRGTVATVLLGGILAIGPVGITLGLTPGAAAQDHTDGGGGNGNGGQGGNGTGGNGNGVGGHGGGHGEVVSPAAIETDDRVPETPMQRFARAFSQGNSYFRFDLGFAPTRLDNANWHPPGAGDPQVYFDLTGNDTGTGSVAFGHDWQNGYRADVAFAMFGQTDFAGDWSYTVPDTAGPHASVSGSVRSTALMLNGYYDIPSAGQSFHPYITGGIGLASHDMSDWTRINPDAGRTTRTFQGGGSTDLALSVGVGMTVDLGRAAGNSGARLDISYRYYDLGTATGGTTPVPGDGNAEPLQALSLDRTTGTLSIGVIIPLN